MTSDFSLQISQELVLTAVAKGIEVNRERIKIYCMDLRDYNQAEVIQAIRKLRVSSTWFPQICEIIDMVKMQGQDAGELATIIASEIIEAISMFGSQDVKGVKEHLGDEKYGIVERSGGWKNLCSITNAEIPSTRAQLRELAKAYINKSKTEGKSHLKLNTEIVKLGELKRVDYKELVS